MAEMLIELYDALRAAQVPDDKARAAATAVTGHSELARRLDSVERRLEHIEMVALQSIRDRLASVENKLSTLWWLTGGVFLMQVGALVKAFWG